jgi:transposase-like protein
MPAGRPTKYDPAMVERVVPFLAQGYSVAALAAEFGVCYDTIKEWDKQHPEFSAAIKIGRQAAAKWWEDVARKNAITGEGNATMAIFGLKNRNRQEWADVRQLDHTSSDRSMSPQAASDAVLEAVALGKLRDAE